MKITLTALSLMLVLGSVSAVQAAAAAAPAIATQHRTTVSSNVSATHNAATSHLGTPMEGDFAATHTVNTQMGKLGVNASKVLDQHPESAAMGFSMTRPGTC